MENENIVFIISKLVNADIDIKEVQAIVSVSETEEFRDSYDLIKNINIAAKPIGRNELKNQFKQISKEFHRDKKIFKIQNLKNWTLPAVAACFFVFIGFNTFFNLKPVSSRDTYKSRTGGGDNSAFTIIQNTEIN